MLCLHPICACVGVCVCARAASVSASAAVATLCCSSRLRHDTRVLALRMMTTASVFLSLEEGKAKWPPAPFKDILPKLEGFPSEDRRGEGSEECTPWGGLDCLHRDLSPVVHVTLDSSVYSGVRGRQSYY